MLRLVYSSENLNDRISRDFFETRNTHKIEKFKSYLLDNGIYYPKNGIIFFSFSSTQKNNKYIIQKFKYGLKKFFYEN